MLDERRKTTSERVAEDPSERFERLVWPQRAVVYRLARILLGDGPAAVKRIPATGSRVLSTLLELRIKSAYITWQYRNIIGNGTPYALVPGYVMPRLTNLYGVRWEFFN